MLGTNVQKTQSQPTINELGIEDYSPRASAERHKMHD